MIVISVTVVSALAGFFLPGAGAVSDPLEDIYHGPTTRPQPAAAPGPEMQQQNPMKYKEACPDYKHYSAVPQ